MITKLLKSLPFIGPKIERKINLRKFEERKSKFKGSSDFWKSNYERGGHSGYGSYDKLALFKAEVLNEFIKESRCDTFVEFGCGDGNQLKLIEYPNYTGYDISEVCIEICNDVFGQDETKQFKLLQLWDENEHYQVSLSLDVIFHLVEDELFKDHMNQLFSSSIEWVIIYASNTDDNADNFYPQVRHRKFTDFIADQYPEWSLDKVVKNRYPFSGSSKTGSFADFYFFRKTK